MPGKQARVLCPVCQEPIPPDETECQNCGAFVIDEAVVRLSRALGLDRDRALKLFEAGFRHPTQLRNRDPNRVLEKGEVGLLFICTNCGGFVAGGDTKCPRCAAEFETDTEEAPAQEEDILDIVLCPICGADNDPAIAECEVCGEPLKQGEAPAGVAPARASAPMVERPEFERALRTVDDFLGEPEPTTPVPAIRPPTPPKEVPVAPPMPAAPRPTPAPRVRPVRRVVREEAPPAPIPRTRPTIVQRPRAIAPHVTVAKSNPPVRTIEEPPKPATPDRLPKKVLSTRSSTKPVTKTLARSPPPKKIRSRRKPPLVVSPETAGASVLASAAGLLLAGVLGQRPVILGIAAFLLGLTAYVSAVFVLNKAHRRRTFVLLPLAAGTGLELLVAFLPSGPSWMFGAIGLAVAGTAPLAWAARQLLRRPERILLAIASAVPLIGQGLVMTTVPAFAPSLAWTVGIVATMPWPAALATAEILRRKSTTNLRRQLVRAERDIQRKDYDQSLQEYERAIASTRAGV
ncbi:MAG: hypothetical protein L3J78_02440, partial [Thermoplasmata archaeon]|nr:hypothetical protein [Thermoplasmata archaeon]